MSRRVCEECEAYVCVLCYLRVRYCDYVSVINLFLPLRYNQHSLLHYLCQPKVNACFGLLVLVGARRGRVQEERYSVFLFHQQTLCNTR